MTNKCTGRDLPLNISHFHILYLAEQVAGEDEVVQSFVGGGEDVVLGAFPLLVSFEYEGNFVADAHHGVHVVGVDDGGHVVLLGDAMDKVVDDE